MASLDGNGPVAREIKSLMSSAETEEVGRGLAFDQRHQITPNAPGWEGSASEEASEDPRAQTAEDMIGFELEELHKPFSQLTREAGQNDYGVG